MLATGSIDPPQRMFETPLPKICPEQQPVITKVSKGSQVSGNPALERFPLQQEGTYCDVPSFALT